MSSLPSARRWTGFVNSDLKRCDRVVELAIAMLSSTDARRCRTLEWNWNTTPPEWEHSHYLEVYLFRSRIRVYPSQDLFSVVQFFSANQNPSWGRSISLIFSYKSPIIHTYETLARKTGIRAERQLELLRAQPSISIRGTRCKTLGR